MSSEGNPNLSKPRYLICKRSRFLNTLGTTVLYGLGGRPAEAVQVLEAELSYSQVKSIYESIYESSRVDMSQAHTLLALWNVQARQSKLVKAEPSYSRALEIHQNVGNDPGRGHELNELGGAQREQFKFAQAEEYYMRALTIFDRMRNNLGRANARILRACTDAAAHCPPRVRKNRPGRKRQHAYVPSLKIRTCIQTSASYLPCI